MSRKSRKGSNRPKGPGTPAARDKADGDDSAETEAEAKESTSFADLMGDARRIDPGPQRAPIPPAFSPAVARSLGNRAARGTLGTFGNSGAQGSSVAAGTNRASAFRWPDPEDRSRAAAEGVSDTTLFALGRGDPAPDERIDLHGARRDAASRLVAKRLESARSRGLRCVLVVHGHGKHSGSGETVLKQALPEWLSKQPCAEQVLAFAPAPRNLGGAGATMVLLRKR